MLEEGPLQGTYHHGNLEAALLAEAVSAVRARGAQNVSLRGLASAVGVSPSAAYQHFGDKDELLAAVGQSGFEVLTERMLAGVARIRGADVPAAIARLEAIGQAYVGFALDEPHLFRLMFGPLCRKPGPDADPGSPTAGETTFGILQQHLAELDRLGALRGPVDDALLLLVWSTVHGFASLAIEGQVDPSATGPMFSSLRGLLYRDGSEG